MPAIPGYVSQYLKANDPDRYFSSLLIRDDARDAIQSLAAFNAEIAAIPDRVRDPAAGEIRLQWWTDALDGQNHGGVHGNPIAAALLGAISRYNLPPAALLRLLEARRFDLYADPMPDLATFEGYAGETTSVLYHLAAMILNGGAPVEAGDAAGHLGVAHALIGHLRAFGHNASRGRIFLPWSILAANGVNENEVFSGTTSEGLLAGLAQLHDIAGDHLQTATIAVGALPRPLRPAFAMIAVLRAELRRLQSHPEAPFAPPAPVADWRRIAALGWWAWRI